MEKINCFWTFKIKWWKIPYGGNEHRGIRWTRHDSKNQRKGELHLYDVVCRVRVNPVDQLLIVDSVMEESTFFVFPTLISFFFPFSLLLFSSVLFRAVSGPGWSRNTAGLCLFNLSQDRAAFSSRYRTSSLGCWAAKRPVTRVQTD